MRLRIGFSAHFICGNLLKMDRQSFSYRQAQDMRKNTY